jgi:hypothetical protein
LKKTERRELLERIIDLAEAVRSRGLDPFDVRVREFFDKLRKLLPELRSYEELYMDAKAVLGLAEVVLHQDRWVRHRSSTLYLDPLLIMLKVRALEPKELAEVLARVWYPVAELEAICPAGIREALDYWTELPPLGERGGELGGTGGIPERLSPSELRRLGLVSEREFEELLREAWEELKELAGERGFIPYWDFVSAGSFRKTIERAWLVSFLVSYGYAELEVKPLEEEILLYPRENPALPRGEIRSVSVSIAYEDWRNRIAGRGG